MTAVLAITLLAFLIKNFYKIIIRKKKHNVMPLLAFYIIAF